MRINQNHILMGILTVILIVPILLKWLVMYLFKESTPDNDWIGFYGTYFGSMIGVMGVYFTMRLDQQKREKERKKEMFLNLLPTYIEIEQVLSYSKLDDVKSGLRAVQKIENWKLLDTELKKRLLRISKTLTERGEQLGVLYMIDDFVRSRLYKEMTSKRMQYFPGPDEEFEVEDVSNDEIQDMATLISRFVDVNLEFEDTIVIQMSLEQFIEALNRDKRLTLLVDRAPLLYEMICDLPESSSWEKYLKKRQETFQEINTIRVILERRIADSLSYIDEL